MQDKAKITNVKLYVITNTKNDKEYIIEDQLMLEDGTSKYTYYLCNQLEYLEPISIIRLMTLLTSAKEIKIAKSEDIRNIIDNLEALIKNAMFRNQLPKKSPYNEDKKYLNEMLLNLQYGFNKQDYGFNKQESRKVL